MALCTAEEVIKYKGIKGDNNDAYQLIDDLCDRLSASIESYCGREFNSTEHTEYHNGDGTTKLYTNNYPIISVTNIWEDTEREWATDTLVSGTEYFVNDGAIYRRDANFIEWSMSIKIVYTAGYVTIPYDLQQACIDEVVRVYDRRKHVGIDAKTYVDYTVSYLTADFLPSTKTVLDLYRGRKII